MPERLVDVPLESLPFVDEHYIQIAAPQDVVWDALIHVVDEMAAGRSAPRISKALGCAQLDGLGGGAGDVGATLPGFMVTRAITPAVLALMGQHRYSRYALIFRILLKPSGLVLLSAQTRAEFPGRSGRAYRSLVVGSRGHVAATTSILRSVRKRAERIATS